MMDFKWALVGAMLVCVKGVAWAHGPAVTCAGGDVSCVIEAMVAANALPATQDPTVIRLGAGRFTLTVANHGEAIDGGQTGLPLVTGSIEIRGEGIEQTILERDAVNAPLFRIVDVAPEGQLTLKRLTVQGGELDERFYQVGGGILNRGNLTLREVMVTRNTAYIGGGIDNQGDLLMVNSVVVRNVADFVGAGVGSLGRTLIRNSVIAENMAESEAGIAFDPAGTLTIEYSLIRGNLAVLNAGGGIGGVGSAVKVKKTIFLGNHAGVRGGAINLDSGKLDIADSTIAGNTAAHFGAGIEVEAGTVTLRDSLVYRNAIVLGGVGGGVHVLNGGQVQLKGSSVLGNAATMAPDCFGPVMQDKRSRVGNPEGCMLTQEGK